MFYSLNDSSINREKSPADSSILKITQQVQPTHILTNLIFEHPLTHVKVFAKRFQHLRLFEQISAGVNALVINWRHLINTLIDYEQRCSSRTG